MKKKEFDKAHKSIYNCIYFESGKMLSGPIRWNALKNIRLKLTRRISFEEIIHARLLDLTDHPNRSDQKILVCEYKGYVWVVPFIFEEDGVFLKTIYPSRKYKKSYEKG
ncbi:MAG: toxin [Candidatus Omnitrophica bacterium]|nr:toxin [Candidatus Omnitrophota bacterium]